jgi:hypothetical protein
MSNTENYDDPIDCCTSRRAGKAYHNGECSFYKETNIMAYGALRLETGKTIYQHNMEVPHKYPLGSLVNYAENKRKSDGTTDVKVSTQGTFIVVGHHRDCDGSPLYTISEKPYAPHVDEHWNYSALCLYANRVPEVHFSCLGEESLTPVPNKAPVRVFSNYIDYLKSMMDLMVELTQNPSLLTKGSL